jgi:hypothetical protein
MPAFRNLTGQRFGRLVAQYYAPPRKWLCQCDCGTEKFVTNHNLLKGATRSCGCLQRDTRKANGRKLKKTISRCPCCGQPAPPLGFNGAVVKLSIMQQALFNAVKNCPDGINVGAIRERLGVEHYSHSYVASTAATTNRKIAAWGVAIKSQGRNEALYRLVRL